MVEFREQQYSAFLKSPDPAIQFFCVYGPDDGLIRERSKALCLSVIDDLNDPFRYCELTLEELLDDRARLSDEMAAISMMGGRRVVRIRKAGNRLTELLKPIVADPVGDALVVIEGGDLKKADSLPKLLKGAGNSAVLPSYADNNRSISALISSTLSDAGLKAPPEVLTYLRDNLGSDRAVSRQELEKLLLFAGAEKAPLTLSDVRTIIGDSSAENIFDIIDATLNGDLPALERSLNKAFEAGDQPIGFLRILLGQLKQLHKAALYRDQGSSIEDAVKKAGITYYKQQSAKSQLSHVGSSHFSSCLNICMTAEIDCKTTGYPAEAICRRALMRISMANRRARGGSMRA